MALSQSLSTGITGLMSHQKAMDNIGNNLANVNTTGFKRGVYQFSTLLEQSLRGGMGADAGTGRGSINPIAMGMGAQTASINKVFTQGDLENTGNPNDMAISGNGFFTVRNGNSYAYTRAGSFYVGAEGHLMAPDGLFVQGTAAVKGANGVYDVPRDAKMQDLIIPIGTVGGHSQTTQAEFTGNLDSRQPVAKGLNLFGSRTYPTVASQQQWMTKDFNGGNILTDPNVDDSWVALEKDTYSVSYSNLAAADAVNANFAISLPSNIVARDDNTVLDANQRYDSDADGIEDTPFVIPTHYYDAATNAIVANVGTPAGPGNVPPAVPPMTGAAIIAAGNVPLVKDIKTINGGNAQTSAAYAIELPEAERRGVTTDSGLAINNDYTMPEWFYESTGAKPVDHDGNGVANYDDIVSILNAVQAGAAPYDGADREQLAFEDIWPNGINNDGTAQSYLPVKGEIYAASVDTPLEHVQYLKGTNWVKPFANISNGDEVNVSFTKGKSQMEIAFVYNKPAGQEPFNGQVNTDRERSYTLGHFLKFMGGDVDEPTLAAQDISPAMFGAPVTTDYPYGNPTPPPPGDPNYGLWANWIAGGRQAYEDALQDVDLAKTDANRDEIGGAMGLLSLPPHIGDGNYGPDAYDVPPESAGAYTRQGDEDVLYYKRWDPVTGSMKTVTGDSFRTSFVSNLGEENALSNIRVSYNNVPHETMYSDETEYSGAQGGSSISTINFYDSLGNPKTANVRMTMVSQDNDFTTWRWYADCADDTDFDWQTDDDGNITTNLNVGTGLIRFDKDGNFVKGAEYSESQGITINQAFRGVNEPIWIKSLNGLAASSKQDLDFSTMTCSAVESDMKLSDQNGRPPSTLDEFTVSPDGTITGVYRNGNTVTLGRIGLAMIPNPNGLVATSGNLFYTGPASGDARYGHANTGGTGTVHQNNLESSNVDLSIEFTKMISTQRGYQANGRTITTADEMIQELLNLKR